MWDCEGAQPEKYRGAGRIREDALLASGNLKDNWGDKSVAEHFASSEP